MANDHSRRGQLALRREARGFQALLKPMQDVMAKDWQVRITTYLEQYIEYLHEIGFINFSEAAIILQNTSTFYCRRVDLIYDWVRQFCISLSSNDFAVEDVPKVKDKPEPLHRKKKNPDENLNHFDFLEVEDFLPAKSRHLINFSNFMKGDLKETLRTTLNKAPFSLGAAVTVYENGKEEMGKKEEFQLHLKVLTDGQLYPDLEDRGYILNNDVEGNDDDLDDVHMVDDLLDGDHVDDGKMEIDGIPPPEIQTDRESLVPLGELPSAELPGPSNSGNNDQSLATPPDEDPFVNVPFSSLLIHRKFKKCVVFTLPKEMIEECKETPKKRKRNTKTKPIPKENYHLSFSELLGGQSEDMIAVRCRNRRSERLQKLQEIKEDVEKGPERSELDDIETDFHEDDVVLEGLREGGSGPTQPSSSFEPEQEISVEEAYKQACRQARQNRKISDALSIQKRVAEWHEAIQPVLQESEKRSQYDMHEYGTKIIDKFSEIGETKSLFDIIDCEDEKDVCRYVLSALMLANTYNVELTKTDPAELSKDCMQLTLLSTVRHHEELDANIGDTAAGAQFV